MFRRVEACFPIQERSIKKRIISELDLFIQDNCGAWELLPDGSWVKCHTPEAEDIISAQENLLINMSEAV